MSSIENAPESGEDSAQLLADVCGLIARWVALTDEQLWAVALWVMHTHAFAAVVTTPYLSIYSAEKESGKTRLLEVLSRLVAKPWFTGRISVAALMRKIEKGKPTLLLDESDTAFQRESDYSEALRGVLKFRV